MKKTALVLIDIQKESQFGINGLEEIVQNAKSLIDACRKCQIPIIYTRQINRSNRVGLSDQEPLDNENKPIYYCSDTEAIEIVEDIQPREEDIVIDKYRWSGFYETHLNLVLRNLGIKNVLIGGLVTDGCVMTSVYDAYFRDYNIHLVKDICGATNEGAHKAAIMIMANWVYNIHVYNTNEVIKKLNGEPHRVWIPNKADQLQFTSENLQTTFNQLDEQATLISGGERL